MLMLASINTVPWTVQLPKRLLRSAWPLGKQRHCLGENESAHGHDSCGLEWCAWQYMDVDISYRKSSVLSVYSAALHPGSLSLSVYVHKTSAVPQSVLWKPLPICVVHLLWCRPAFFEVIWFCIYYSWIFITQITTCEKGCWCSVSSIEVNLLAAVVFSMCSERWCDMIEIPAHLINGPQVAKVVMCSQKC